jgi:hypothetical protein
MQTVIRHRLAAAALLLPLGFVALPHAAQAQPAVVAPSHAVAPSPQIERFTVAPHGRLLPGRVLRFHLEGAPRASAWVDIPGVVSHVALREVRRGVYEGTYTIRRRDDLRAFDRAVATLRRGPVATTARVDFGSAPGADHRPPRVTQVTPGNGDRVDEQRRTLIRARLSDAGSGVDPRTVRLMVDGLDVTANARVTDDAVSYRERLGHGRHQAELVVRDRAGNVSRVAWSFRVV